VQQKFPRGALGLVHLAGAGLPRGARLVFRGSGPASKFSCRYLWTKGQQAVKQEALLIFALDETQADGDQRRFFRAPRFSIRSSSVTCGGVP
jgi:hypothetical protein